MTDDSSATEKTSTTIPKAAFLAGTNEESEEDEPGTEEGQEIIHDATANPLDVEPGNPGYQAAGEGRIPTESEALDCLAAIVASPRRG